MKDILQQLNKATKVLLFTGLALILYGSLCRLIGLYFFWESTSIGWIIVLFGIIAFLSDRIKTKTIDNRQTVVAKIGIGFIIFILLIQSILMAVIPFSNAYSAAKTYLINDVELKKEIGNITGFGLIPLGGIHTKSESGDAEINMTVKGEKKFKDLTIYVVKNADSPNWEVESVE